MAGPVQRRAFQPDDVDRWRAAGALAAGLAVAAWLLVIIFEVAVPETQFRAEGWVRTVAVIAWALGVAATATTAVVVPPLVFPGVRRAARVTLAVTATVAAMAAAVAVGDLDGFDARGYFDRHRAEFVELAARADAVLADAVLADAVLTDAVLAAGPAAGLSVDGTVNVLRVGAVRVLYVPQRTRPAAGYAWLDRMPPHGFGVPVGDGVRPPSFPLDNGWWWIS